MIIVGKFNSKIVTLIVFLFALVTTLEKFTDGLTCVSQMKNC